MNLNYAEMYGAQLTVHSFKSHPIPLSHHTGVRNDCLLTLW